MFNPSEPHGIVYNHPDIAFVQEGVNYGHDKKPVAETKVDPATPAISVIEGSN